MAAYLSVNALQRAVQRLGSSAARSRVGDYFIFKRASTVSGNSTVELSEKNASWTTSILDLAAVRGDVGWAGPNYFNPFGAARDTKTAGFRSDKYTSNGSSNTVMDWHGKADSPIERVPPMRPASIRSVSSVDSDQMARFFLVRGGAAPTLIDAAVWWFRHTDLTALTPQPVTTASLVDAFRAEVGLTALEEQSIFSELDAGSDSSLDTQSTPANPSEYLPRPPARTSKNDRTPTPPSDDTTHHGELAGNLDEAVKWLVTNIEARGFAFQPWQIAAFVTAVRTKPLVLLAGISGTGKTALPRLVAEATGATTQTVAVRPDWTDSSDLLGRLTLNETFVPGSMVVACQAATADPTTERFFVLDEMNIARVEYYMAEILSRVEEREMTENGPVTREPLLATNVPEEYRDVRLPGNIAIVGSVNMDESTHDFSRKVMDRSFIIEFSNVDLNAMPGNTDETIAPMAWPVEWWKQRYLRLADLDQNTHAETILRTIGALTAVNEHLTRAQLQVGYRVRDEIAMFCVNAHECVSSFVYGSGAIVDPLDLAICLKVLPRILGGEVAIRKVLEGLLKWANGVVETVDADDTINEEAEVTYNNKNADTFPECAKKIEMMLERMTETGYASYWT